MFCSIIILTRGEKIYFSALAEVSQALNSVAQRLIRILNLKLFWKQHTDIFVSEAVWSL